MGNKLRCWFFGFGKAGSGQVVFGQYSSEIFI
jgi:hypothetical protein